MGDVVFLESNATGTALEAMRMARARGHKVRFLTAEPEFYDTNKVPVWDAVDSVHLCNTYDLSHVVATMGQLNPIGILAFDDFRLVNAAMAAQVLDLPHLPLSGLINCRFKHLARAALRDEGAPWFSTHDDLASLQEMPPKLPFVLKAVDDSGSVGVFHCREDADLARACDFLSKHRINPRGYRLLQKFLVEEAIEGPEYSAEVIWDQHRRKWHLVGFTAKSTSAGLYSVETGHIFPHDFGHESQQQYAATIERWLLTLDLRGGVAHVEFRIRDGRPVLIEVNPRPAGGRISELVKLACGFDIVKAYFDYHLGDGVALAPAPSRCYAGIAYITSTRRGIVSGVDVPEALASTAVKMSLPGIGSVAPGLTSNNDRLGYAIFSRSDRQGIEASMAEFLSGLQLSIQPNMA